MSLCVCVCVRHMQVHSVLTPVCLLWHIAVFFCITHTSHVVRGSNKGVWGHLYLLPAKQANHKHTTQGEFWEPVRVILIQAWLDHPCWRQPDHNTTCGTSTLVACVCACLPHTQSVVYGFKPLFGTCRYLYKMLLIYYINITFIHLACDYLHIRPYKRWKCYIKKIKKICYVLFI